ncbi:MAG TPA: amidase [Terriglobales bacterium]|jgi:Asp-tRNA(Asn)/Glu-tRNA(Gln) amidotransferase A subunit family amidase
MNILETSELLRSRRVSPVELTKECLARIEKLNPALNAFINVTGESALAEARRAEEEIQRGDWRGPLHGIPIALKDLIDVAGVPTTAASNLFRNRIATEDAGIVRQLKNAGAVFLGKQNLHEFAYGGSSMISAYGPVRNPWNLEHIAGGSSGGSAASVAAGLCYAAIGTDTAGSIREPAALCGVVGLKPSFDLVSVRGIFPLSKSYDHAGPLTRTVADAAIVLQAIVDGNKEPNEFISALNAPLPQNLRLGVIRSFFFEDIDLEVSAATEEALKVLSSVGQLRDIALEQVPVDRTLQAAESYDTHAELVSKNPELYQPETLRRITNGANAEPGEIARRRQELEQQRREIAGVFENADFLITPSVPIPASLVSKLREEPERLRPAEILLLRNTRPFNVWGVPAISVPCGFTKSGLPVGLQIAGPYGAEAAVLQLAHIYEQRTGWHRLQPSKSRE